MEKNKIYGWILIFFILICLPAYRVMADGVYVSKSQSVAISSDQRAIIIQNGDEISMTFSFGYTGGGEDFGWIIPTPVPPAIEDVGETGENGGKAFEMLDSFTAPEIYMSGGCFPAGTEVLTKDGPRRIETADPGTMVSSYEISSGVWTFTEVTKQGKYLYEGDLITIWMGRETVEATANHLFYVLRGEELSSRPLSPEISETEQRSSGRGRWVQARDLKTGDILKSKNSGDLIVTNLSGQHVKMEVYHLEVDKYHNYAVHRKGILVHNGGYKEGGETESKQLVKVYGTVLLEHYEVSVIGAADVSALLEWLKENGYQVNPAARGVLDIYIKENWAFIAVKLNPGERRHYENEFLPPLTVKYKHDQLIFPLKISSVSTTTEVGITLYVIAESTVSSSNLTTIPLDYEEELTKWVDAGKYVESCIRKTLENHRSGLVLMWSGEFASPADDEDYISNLMKFPFPEGKMKYLTRLETRMDQKAMTNDIWITLDPSPKDFEIRIWARAGWGPEIILAAREGNTEFVRDLLEAGADVDASDVFGYTALKYAAAMFVHTEIVQILLEAGADVNATDNSGLTVLMNAALYGDTEVVQILLSAGAAVNATDNSGLTALMSAALYGDTEVVQILLSAGADVNESDDNSHTALFNAVKGGYTEVMQLLLNAGADVNAKNKFGLTALIFAAGDGRTEVVKILLDAGTDVNAKSELGLTAIWKALEAGRTEVVQILLQAGATLNAMSIGYETVLIEATRGGNIEIVQILVQSGANVDARSDNGNTVLIEAARGGHTEVVKILLQAGADVNAKNNDSKSALMLAKESGNEEVVELLSKSQKKIVVYAVAVFLFLILVVSIGYVIISKKLVPGSNQL